MWSFLDWTVARTLLRGRWSAGVLAESRCSLASEFYQTTCWWEPADAPHQSHPESCACARAHPTTTYSKGKRWTAAFVLLNLWRKKQLNSFEEVSLDYDSNVELWITNYTLVCMYEKHLPVYGVSVFKECPRPWARSTDIQNRQVIESSFRYEPFLPRDCAMSRNIEPSLRRLCLFTLNKATAS